MQQVTIEPGWDFGHNRYAVHEWSEDRSTSMVISTHSAKESAIAWAAAYSKSWGRHFYSAEIIPLRRRKEVLF